MCGDSTNSDDIDLLIDNAKDVDLMTDPPYGINAEKMTLGSGKKDFYRGDWDSEIPDFFPQLKRFNKIVLWGANYYTDRLMPSNDWLCWHKKDDGLSFSEFELAWSNLGKNCRHIQHHWSGEKKVHPTQKPYPVIEWAVEFLEKNIVDLFGGSGTTLIACEKTNRKCMMMELDPKYVDVIVKRWQEYTGKKAIHAESGEEFIEVSND
jgi:DNA modification methylase